jgi:hypothetical protein
MVDVGCYLFCTLSLSLSLSLSLFGLILIYVPHEPQDFVAVKCGGRSRGQRGTEERRLSGYALVPQSPPHSLSLLTHSLMHSLTHSCTHSLTHALTHSLTHLHFTVLSLLAECSDTCALVPPADKSGFPCYQGSIKDANFCYDTVSE